MVSLMASVAFNLAANEQDCIRHAHARRIQSCSLGIFVLLVCPDYPNAQSAKCYGNDSKKCPEPGEAYCVCLLHRVGNISERAESSYRDTKTYRREDR
jgi:hypothetical protein